MINAARVIAQEPEHPAPQNSGARSNSWTGLHLSSPPPNCPRSTCWGPHPRCKPCDNSRFNCLCSKPRSNFGAPTLANQAWRYKLGAHTLALKLWHSNFGAPTLALQLWRSNLGAPTLALRLWRSSLGAQIWRPNVGDPTVALKPWHHKSSPYRINHESYNMNQDPSTTNN